MIAGLVIGLACAIGFIFAQAVEIGNLKARRDDWERAATIWMRRSKDAEVKAHNLAVENYSLHKAIAEDLDNDYS